MTSARPSVNLPNQDEQTAKHHQGTGGRKNDRSASKRLLNPGLQQSLALEN